MLIAFSMLCSSVSYAQWEQEYRLTNDPDTSQTITNYAWAVAASGDSIHVVWTDGREGNYEIFYNRSTDAGLSWRQLDERLTNNPAGSGCPAVAVSGPYVHVVWLDDRHPVNEVFYLRSTDAGLSWAHDTALTNSSIQKCGVTVAASGSGVHVSWDESGDTTNNIYYKRSTNDGLSWEPDTLLVPGGIGGAIAVSGSFVHFVWSDDAGGVHPSEIFYKRSTDGGNSWGGSAPITFSGTLLLKLAPTIAVSDSVVHVAWMQGQQSTDIYYKRSINRGENWPDDFQNVQISDAHSEPLPNSIAASGSVVHVLWCDDTTGNYEIYHRVSTNEGASWEPQITNLSDSIDLSINASIAVSGTTAHVVWTDYRQGGSEIYYKRCLRVVPVELMVFSAVFDEATSSIILNWRTATESLNHGFEIERIEKGSWTKLGFVSGNGTTTEEQSYTYVDRDVQMNRSYVYRLKQIDTDGSFEYSQTVEVDMSRVTTKQLDPNYPNPFSRSTVVSYAIPEDGRVLLRVFDINGREIATLVDAEKPSGRHQAVFDGSDLPGGMYVCRLESGGTILSRVMSQVK